jgi:hypothetical protein
VVLKDYDVSQIELCKPVEDRKEGGEYKDGEASYPPNVLVSAILGGFVGTFENPILIRTTQQGI